MLRNKDWKTIWANFRTYRGNFGGFVQDIKLPYELFMWYILYGGILKVAYDIDITTYIKEFAIIGTILYVIIFWFGGQIKWIKDLQNSTAQAGRKHNDVEMKKMIAEIKEIHKSICGEE